MVTYADNLGKVRLWEKVERCSRRNGPNDSDGVMICAKIEGGALDGCVPFVVQFRPCLGRQTLEYPAGLVDKGESYEQAGIRELREETGLEGRVVSVSPEVFLDPGVSNCSMRIVTMVVDGSLPQNQNPKQSLDEGEFCEVHYLKNPTKDSIFEFGKDLAIQSNVFFGIS